MVIDRLIDDKLMSAPHCAVFRTRTTDVEAWHSGLPTQGYDEP